jgi:hypothetical protein
MKVVRAAAMLFPVILKDNLNDRARFQIFVFILKLKTTAKGDWIAQLTRQPYWYCWRQKFKKYRDVEVSSGMMFTLSFKKISQLMSTMSIAESWDTVH